MSDFFLSNFGVINTDTKTRKNEKPNNQPVVDSNLIKVRMFTQGSSINTNDQAKVNALRESQNTVNTQNFSRTEVENKN